MNMRYAWTVGLLVGLLLGGTAAAQPTPENLCIQQVGEHYQVLVKDQVLTGIPDLAWSQQLLALVSGTRELLTRYEIKRNQGDLAERNVAQLLEQLRQAQAQMAQMRKELESLKGEATTAPSPRN